MVLFRVEKKSRSERERNIEKHESRQAGGLSSEPLLSPWYIYLLNAGHKPDHRPHAS